LLDSDEHLGVQEFVNKILAIARSAMLVVHDLANKLLETRLKKAEKSLLLFCRCLAERHLCRSSSMSEQFTTVDAVERTRFGLSDDSEIVGHVITDLSPSCVKRRTQPIEEYGKCKLEIESRGIRALGFLVRTLESNGQAIVALRVSD
jgi:hypothetical protein